MQMYFVFGTEIHGRCNVRIKMVLFRFSEQKFDEKPELQSRFFTAIVLRSIYSIYHSSCLYWFKLVILVYNG